MTQKPDTQPAAAHTPGFVAAEMYGEICGLWIEQDNTRHAESVIAYLQQQIATAHSEGRTEQIVLELEQIEKHYGKRGLGWHFVRLILRANISPERHDPDGDLELAAETVEEAIAEGAAEARRAAFTEAAKRVRADATRLDAWAVELRQSENTDSVSMSAEAERLFSLAIAIESMGAADAATEASDE